MFTHGLSGCGERGIASAAATCRRNVHPRLPLTTNQQGGRQSYELIPGFPLCATAWNKQCSTANFPPSTACSKAGGTPLLLQPVEREMRARTPQSSPESNATAEVRQRPDADPLDAAFGDQAHRR